MRLAVWLAAGAVPAVLVPGGGALVATLLALLAAAACVDRCLTPDPRRLELERKLSRRVAQGGELVRRIRVVAADRRGGAALRIEVHEAADPSLAVVARTFTSRAEATRPGVDRELSRADATRQSSDRDHARADVTILGTDRALAPPRARSADPSGGPDVAWLAPKSGEPLELVRVYRPARRGTCAVGDLRMRVRGPLGLVERSARFAASLEARVEPALAGLASTLALAATRRRDSGARNPRRFGGRSEFESLREYVAGDDPRQIDWKATARRQRTIVREHQEERGRELLILVERGRRMAAPSLAGAPEVGATKLDHAIDAALQVAAVALAEGDRVGAAVFDVDLARYVAPERSRGQFRRIEESLFDVQPSEEEADLAGALRRLATRQRRRATLLLIGDVADPYSLPRQRAALAFAARHHATIFAVLDDPDVRLAAAGGSAGPAAEDGPGPAPDAAHRASALAALAERAAAVRALRASGARVLDSLPAEAAGRLVAAWLDARRAGVA